MYQSVQSVSPGSHVINWSGVSPGASRYVADSQLMPRMACTVAGEKISDNKTQLRGTEDGNCRGEKRAQETNEAKPEVEEGGQTSGNFPTDRRLGHGPFSRAGGQRGGLS